MSHNQIVIPCHRKIHRWISNMIKWVRFCFNVTLCLCMYINDAICERENCSPRNMVNLRIRRDTTCIIWRLSKIKYITEGRLLIRPSPSNTISILLSPQTITLLLSLIANRRHQSRERLQTLTDFITQWFDKLYPYSVYHFF